MFPLWHFNGLKRIHTKLYLLHLSQSQYQHTKKIYLRKGKYMKYSQMCLTLYELWKTDYEKIHLRYKTISRHFQNILRLTANLDYFKSSFADESKIICFWLGPGQTYPGPGHERHNSLFFALSLSFCLQQIGVYASHDILIIHVWTWKMISAFGYGNI